MTRLIDADALNYSTHRECAGHGEYYEIEIITKSKIDNAPTIDAEPVRHGEWIESKERSKHWYCSVCGCIHTDPETGKWRETFDYRYPFCPNCGAKMYKE